MGLMPIVTILPAAAAWMASRTASWNRPSGLITWSAANEPMMVSGSRSCRIAAAKPMAAPESLGSLSSTRSASSISGSWRQTASRWAMPVTTSMCLPASGSSRS